MKLGKLLTLFISAWHNVTFWLKQTSCPFLFQLTLELQPKLQLLLRKESLLSGHLIGKWKRAGPFLSDFCWLSLPFSTKTSCSSSALHGVTSELSPVQDGSRSSSSGEERWLQPAVWHLGCRHHFYRAGRAAASDVWPSPHEVSLLTSSLFLQPSCCLVAHLTLSVFLRALFLMSKSSFQPPKLKDKNKWWVSRMLNELFLVKRCQSAHWEPNCLLLQVHQLP